MLIFSSLKEIRQSNETDPNYTAVIKRKVLRAYSKKTISLNKSLARRKASRRKDKICHMPRMACGLHKLVSLGGAPSFVTWYSHCQLVWASQNKENFLETKKIFFHTVYMPRVLVPFSVGSVLPFFGNVGILMTHTLPCLCTAP